MKLRRHFSNKFVPLQKSSQAWKQTDQLSYDRCYTRGGMDAKFVLHNSQDFPCVWEGPCKCPWYSQLSSKDQSYLTNDGLEFVLKLNNAT